MSDSARFRGDWSAPLEFPGGPGSAYHIWLIELGPGGDPAALASLLSLEETDRADRFRSPEARRRFVVSRARVREILATYLGLDPSGLTFEYGPAGKPRLRAGAETGESARPGHTRETRSLAFNVTHSRDLALCAICEEGEVGIDLEGIRPLRDIGRLAERHFSPEEFDRWTALGPSDRLDGFYRVWTRKEALLKAAGLGLSRPLERVDSERGTVDDGSYWLTDLDLARLGSDEAFRAAVAGERQPTEIRCWTWTGRA